jgi:putative FmdB family regulatory protein
MPIYEFECRSCQNVWDNLQKISDPDPSNCPACHQPQVQRRMTAAAFRLKGAGWYETDFKKEGDTKRNLVDASASPEVKSDTTDGAKAANTSSTSDTSSTAPAASTPAPAPGPAPASDP